MLIRYSRGGLEALVCCPDPHSDIHLAYESMSGGWVMLDKIGLWADGIAVDTLCSAHNLHEGALYHSRNWIHTCCYLANHNFDLFLGMPSTQLDLASYG